MQEDGTTISVADYIKKHPAPTSELLSIPKNPSSVPILYYCIIVWIGLLFS